MPDWEASGPPAAAAPTAWTTSWIAAQQPKRDADGDGDGPAHQEPAHAGRHMRGVDMAGEWLVPEPDQRVPYRARRGQQVRRHPAKRSDATPDREEQHEAGDRQSPALTTVHVPTARIGAAAAPRVLDRLAGRKAARVIELPIELVMRRSSAPPKA